jgi:hypothetical protein
MLAYLLWHRPAADVEPPAYEQAATHFHRSLAHSRPAGFLGSALYRVAGLPWLDAGAADGTDEDGLPQVGSGAADAGSEGESGRKGGRGVGFEDWYLLSDFTALGVLNEAAVAHGHRSAHDAVARRFGWAAGGLYGLLEGCAGLPPAGLAGDSPLAGAAGPGDASGGLPATAAASGDAPSDLAIWIARPPGAVRRGLGDLLGDGIDPTRSSLWRRSLVFGPAPEYCVLAPSPPAGVGATRLPAGWDARVCPREVVWRG